MRAVWAMSQANGSLRIILNTTMSRQDSVVSDSPKIAGYEACDGITTVSSLNELVLPGRKISSSNTLT